MLSRKVDDVSFATFCVLGRFDFAAMETFGGAEMTKRFKEALVTGEKTSESDERILEKALFEWCASKGCINYAHW